MSRADFVPIEDHAAIGDLHTVALVTKGGSIDWCCFPHLDDPSAFAALLDRERGGHFRIAPVHGEPVDQRYVRHTNVLETEFAADNGRLIVTDFMPLGGSIAGRCHGGVENAIYRILTAEGGAVEVEVEWCPRLDYARGKTRIVPERRGFRAHCGAGALLLSGLPSDRAELIDDGSGPVVRARFLLRPAQPLVLVTRWAENGGAKNDGEEVAYADAFVKLERTIAEWRRWVHEDEATGSREWADEWREQVIRSELVVKLLSHAETGAIAAAATTSLPEEIGGTRNWDYRYSWIRDSALAAQALFSLGHRSEAEAFIDWTEHNARSGGDRGWGLRILYGFRDGHDFTEQELSHLDGYRGSKPVRIGNAAVDQLQLDVFGELLSSAYEVHRLGGHLDQEVMDFLPFVADQACRAWQEPDYGIWELRNGPCQLVHSKVMVWVALDRALRLADQGLIRGNVEKWRQSRAAVRRAVLEQGFDVELGAFTQGYDRKVLDAANVRIPVLEFLPADDPRVQGTLDRTLERLTHGDLVYRYKADDGLPGGEGAFASCTFWLVDALCLSRRMDEAHELFEGLFARRNHVGLWSEEIDPTSGAFLGNFPQVYVHVGFINSALYLAEAEGRKLPIPSLMGSDLRKQKLRNQRERSADPD